MLRFTAKRLTIDRMFNFRNQVVSTKIFNIIHRPMKLQTLTLSAVALTLSLGAIVPSAAQAATMTYTSAPISFDQDAEANSSGYVASSTLPYFNAALGTLNQVYYEFLGEVAVAFTYTNNSKKSNNVEAFSYFSIFGNLNPGSNYYNGSADAYANPGFLVVAAGQTKSSSDTDFLLNDGFGTPGDFISSGSYAVNFGSYFLPSLSNFGASNFSFATTGEAKNLFARVTYDYTPTAVPTPALLPGLIGLGFTALRKRKEKAAVA
jgi:hypothetical protein